MVNYLNESRLYIDAPGADPGWCEPCLDTSYAPLFLCWWKITLNLTLKIEVLRSTQRCLERNTSRNEEK